MRPSRPPGSGLDATQIKAISYGLYVWGVTDVVVLVVGGMSGMDGLTFLLLMTVGGATIGGVVGLMAAYSADRLGERARMIYAPTGSSTPYEDQYSFQQAMAMRGDVAGALRSFEALIAESPKDPAPRLAAAELYAGPGKDPRRAAELYREARSLPSATAKHDMAATNALIDLYRGALADPGRAMSELRRLADRYAGTVPGEMARRALSELKGARPAAPS